MERLMIEHRRANTSQLAASHSDLQQLDTKTQTALVTILALTQVTELKLLLDAGPDGHAYYAFVLTLLVASIGVEALLTTVIIYIGNLRLDPLLSDRVEVRGSARKTDGVDADDGGERRFELDADGAEVFLEVARMRLADLELDVIRTANQVAALEAIARRCPEVSALTEELERKRAELKSAVVEMDRMETERRTAEARLQRTLVVERRARERSAAATFRTVSCWQRTATYLLHFVMLINVFITVFGISGSHRANAAAAAAQNSHVISPPVALPPSLHPPSYRLNDSAAY